MSWSRLLVVMAVLALGPAGCGFKPLYGKGDSQSAGVAPELASIRIAAIEDRKGQEMRNFLVQGMNPRGEPGDGRYRLEVRLLENTSGLAQTSDGKSTVGRMSITAQYQLYDETTGKVVHTASTRAAGSYRYLGPRYGSMVSESDTESAIIERLANDVRLELSAWFMDRRPDKRPLDSPTP